MNLFEIFQYIGSGLLIVPIVAPEVGVTASRVVQPTEVTKCYRKLHRLTKSRYEG